MKFRIIIYLSNNETVFYDNVEYISVSKNRYLHILTERAELKFKPKEYKWFEMAAIIE